MAKIVKCQRLYIGDTLNLKVNLNYKNFEKKQRKKHGKAAKSSWVGENNNPPYPPLHRPLMF